MLKYYMYVLYVGFYCFKSTHKTTIKIYNMTHVSE